jgi:hypothetical protein
LTHSEYVILVSFFFAASLRNGLELDTINWLEELQFWLKKEIGEFLIFDYQ